MRKLISLMLVLSLLLGCVGVRAEETADTPEFKRLSDPELRTYLEGEIYGSLVTTLDSDQYFVENVSAIYISQEYLDELAYNSQANIFFGFTLDELDAQFEGTKYVFTLGDNGQTVVEPFESYDDTYDRMLHNVAIGTGVILVCVTVSVVSAGAGAPAVSMIFAMAAKSGTTAALSGGALGGLSAAIFTGIQTGDMDAAMKAGADGFGEGFKWGAISGALAGGTSEAATLKGATLNGLTMNQAAIIQRETGWPLDVIKGFKTMDQYKICKDAGLLTRPISNKAALVRSIDLNFTDEMGRTNLQRMQQGLAALDPDGIPYELHHIGQNPNSTLAILTKSEHMQHGNNTIWHEFGGASQINRASFDKQRITFWKDLADLFLIGGV